LSVRRQRQLTVSPRETVLDLGLKKSSRTDTERVSLAVPRGLSEPPEAGIATSKAASVPMTVI
jgi:hypothetical protein